MDLHVRNEGAARGVVVDFIKAHIQEVMASKDWGEFVKSSCHGALITEIRDATVAEHRDSE